MRTRLIAFGALAALATLVSAQAKLDIGSPAPKLTIAKWVKGEPFVLNHKDTYVVEFWATWCDPCKATIPHVTSLAKKYGSKVKFAGISIWERQEDKNFMAGVEKFVKDMGKQMDYVVGAEGAKREMADDWMKAAGEMGIPSAFVVHQGRIAWIGHPMDGLEEVIDEVLKGGYDFDVAKKKRTDARQAAIKEAREQQRLMMAMGPVQEALASGDVAKGLAELEKLFVKNPDDEKILWELKVNVLLDHDETLIGPYFDKLSTGMFKEDAMNLNSMAWKIVDPEVSWRKPDYAQALKLATKCDEVSGHKKWEYLDTLALCQFHNKMLDEAIKNQELAVKLMKESKEADEDTQKELEGRLEKFKKAKGG